MKTCLKIWTCHEIMWELLLKFIIQLKHVWKKNWNSCENACGMFFKLIDMIEIGWHMSGITKMCVNSYELKLLNIFKQLKIAWNVYEVFFITKTMGISVKCLWNDSKMIETCLILNFLFVNICELHCNPVWNTKETLQ